MNCTSSCALSTALLKLLTLLILIHWQTLDFSWAGTVSEESPPTIAVDDQFILLDSSLTRWTQLQHHLLDETRLPLFGKSSERDMDWVGEGQSDSLCTLLSVIYLKMLSKESFTLSKEPTLGAKFESSSVWEKILSKHSHIHSLSTGCGAVALHRQSWVIAAEIKWPAKPKRCSILPFTERGCWLIWTMWNKYVNFNQ